MMAAVWHGRGDVRVEDVPDAPDPRGGEVRIAVEWCGICGTDLEEWREGPVVIPTEPHGLTGKAAPIVLGHEVAGRVEALGPHVDTLRPGDLVALDAVLSCGSCWWCARHQVTLCPQFAAIGLHRDGGLAERVTVPAAMCVRVPSSVDSATAALAEPLAVALRGLRKGRFAVGESIAVLGAGTIGLATLVAARNSGAGRVIVVDPVPARRRLAASLGADATIDPLVDGFVGAVAEESEGRGVDVAIDAAGTSTSARQAVDVARAGGRTVIVGLSPTPMALDLIALAAGEKEIIGSMAHVWDEDFAAAVRFLERGHLRSDDIVGQRISLEDTVTVGFATLQASPVQPKVLVSPTI